MLQNIDINIMPNTGEMDLSSSADQSNIKLTEHILLMRVLCSSSCTSCRVKETWQQIQIKHNNIYTFSASPN